MLALYLAMCSSEEERDKVEYIYVNYRPLMYKAVYRLVENEDVASDIVHDTIVKLIQSNEGLFKGDKMPNKTYVMTTAVRTAIDYLRYSNKREIFDIDDPDVHYEPVDDSLTVLDNLINAEGYNHVVRCIQSLPATLRHACYLKYVCELDDNAIAKVLKVSYGTVAMRIHRGRKLLQEVLEGVQEK